MGGAAFTIYGKYSGEEESKKGLFSRMFKKESQKSVREKTVTKEFKADFVEYIDSKLENDITVSVVKDYLKMKGIFECFIREHNGIHCIDITFSGCAGMAQVSSEVCAHWAEFWHKENRKKIEEIAKRNGFNPDGRAEGMGKNEVFVPAGAAGYALLIVDESSEKEMLPPNIFKTTFFEVDESYMEGADEKEFVELNDKLNLEYSGAVKERKCMCAFCRINVG